MDNDNVVNPFENHPKSVMVILAHIIDQATTEADIWVGNRVACALGYGDVVYEFLCGTGDFREFITDDEEEVVNFVKLKKLAKEFLKSLEVMENFKSLFVNDCIKLLQFVSEDDIRELRIYKDNLPTSEESLQIAIELFESENAEIV